MIVALPLNYVVSIEYENQRWNSPYTFKVNKLEKEHTYVVIFSLCNAQQKECLLKSNKVKILYHGPAAINKSPGHGQIPRNEICIFEMV